MEYALITGIILCFATYAMDFVLARFGTTAAETIINDAAGTLAALFFLSASHEKQNYENAKERMRLVAQLNSRIREAFGVVAASALSDDRRSRLQGIDAASERVDAILGECMNLADAPPQTSNARQARLPHGLFD